MSNKRFYQETFSQVHGTREIRWEDYQTMKHGKSLKWVVSLAAAAGLLAALSALALAANFFGLRDVLLPEKHSVDVLDENGAVVPGEREFQDFVSLSGWGDAPESRALAEWEAFLEGYDRDGAIIGEIGNEPTGFEDRYGLYLVYTQEMADKLEEIIARYGLKLHEWMEVVLPETWGTAVGNFFKENVTPYSGYIYENGTFRFDGDAALEGYGTVDYQFSRSVKGTFDDVALNIGDLSDFEEWGYRAADGTPVTLGLGARTRSLILADLGDSFVLVNVLAGKEADDTFSSGAIGRAELEELADSFVYSALTPVREPDLDAILDANTRQMEELQNQPIETSPEAEDPLYIQTGIAANVGREFVLNLADLLAGGRKEDAADLLVYPAQVKTTGGEWIVNTPEEFLEHYDESAGAALAADLRADPEPFGGGTGLASAAGGAVWFGQTEDGQIRVFTLQSDVWQWSVRYWGERP